MDIRAFLDIKEYSARNNSKEQAMLSNKETAHYWSGKADAYRELLDVVSKGLITTGGIEQLTYPEVK
jgi:hypothetical protein